RGQQGRDGEDGDAGDVQAAPAQDVGEAAGGGQQGGEQDGVQTDHPRQVGQRGGGEVAGQVRHGQVGHGGVEHGQEGRPGGEQQDAAVPGWGGCGHQGSPKENIRTVVLLVSRVPRSTVSEPTLYMTDRSVIIPPSGPPRNLASHVLHGPRVWVGEDKGGHPCGCWWSRTSAPSPMRSCAACAARAWPWTWPTTVPTGTRRRSSPGTTWWSSTATCPVCTATGSAPTWPAPAP